MIVDLDPGSVIIVNSGGFESKAIHYRDAARGYQYIVKGNFARRAAAFYFDRPSITGLLRTVNPTIFNNLDALTS